MERDPNDMRKGAGLWRRRPGIRFTDGSRTPEQRDAARQLRHLMIGLFAIAAIVAMVLLLISYMPITVRG